MAREGQAASYPHWGVGSSAPRAIRQSEAPWEQRVSAYLGQMQLLWVAVDDEPGPASDRGHIERHSIALLSQEGPSVDPASDAWLGRDSLSPAIRDSGLWNVNHTADNHDPAFLQVLEGYVAAM